MANVCGGRASDNRPGEMIVPSYWKLVVWSAVLFVGPHAAAAMPQAPPAVALVRAFEPLAYPVGLILKDIGAVVTVRVALDVDGRVTSAQVVSIETGPVAEPREAAGARDAFERVTLRNVERWTFAPGAATVVVTYVFQPTYETCERGATILRVDGLLATVQACRPALSHGPWSNDGEVATFVAVAHPGSRTPSKGVATVFLELEIQADGRVGAVRTLSGPADLAALSEASARRLEFFGDKARKVFVAYRFSVVRGKCHGTYTGVSGAGTIFNVIGCTD